MTAANETKRLEDFLASSERSPNTLKAYRQDWNQFATWHHGANAEPFDLCGLTCIDVQDWKRSEVKRGRKPNTINRRLTFLKSYAAWGAAKGVIAPEIVEHIRQIKPVRKQALAPKSLPVPEVRKLLRELELRGGPRDRAIIYLFLYTGLRVGELVRLAREDAEITERKGRLRIRAETTKGGKERVVPVPLEARKRLQEYLESREDGGGALFVGQRGELHEDAIGKLLGRYSNGAHITPHLLRHTFAYRYLERNQNDLVGLAAILGHEDLNTTRIYTQKRLEDLEDASEQVDYS